MHKRRKICVILIFIIIMWVAFIFLLSTQNGSSTEHTSYKFAKRIVNIFINNPDQHLLHRVDMKLRLYAHIFLFSILGICAGSLSILFEFKNSIKGYIISSVVCGLIGFFDEWHKQFISGRHFDKGETVLNILSSLIGILCVYLVVKIYRHIKSKKIGLSSNNSNV